MSAKKTAKKAAKKAATRTAKKPKGEAKKIDAATGLRQRALKSYGSIPPDEVATAYIETKKEAAAKGKSMLEVCPQEIRRDVLAAVANKIKPERIADVIGELLSAERQQMDGSMAPDYRAKEAGTKIYLLLMDIVGQKSGDAPKNDVPTSEAEEELLKRIGESEVAFAELQRALERTKSTKTRQIIDAEILPNNDQ